MNDTKIDVLDLDLRTYNALRRAGVSTIEDIENQMEQLENIIPKKIEAVRDSLAKYKGIPASPDSPPAPAQSQKSYMDILKAHYPNVNCDDLYNDYCPADFFDGAIYSTHDSCTDNCEACWRMPANEIWHEKKYAPESWKAAKSEDDEEPDSEELEQKKPQDTSEEISAPAQSEAAAPAVFDYSELDADTAAKLENVTAEIFNVRKEYIFTMAKKVAYAHDLLANCGNGKFGAWCESIGITRQTGNNLIQIVKLFDNSTSEEQENLNKLADGNVKLLYEAARPSAPPVLVEQVKSGDITTHKEYIALKKQLEEAEEKNEFWEKANSETNKENQQLRYDRNAALTRASNAEKQLEEAEEMNAVLSAEKEQFHRASKANLEKLNEERDRNTALERQIKELESRPRDVAVDTEELNRRVTEVSVKLQNQAAEQIAEERRDFADKLNRMEDERDRLENRIAELENSSTDNKAKDREIAELKQRIERMSDSNVKSYVIRLTVNEFTRLTDIVKNSDDSAVVSAVKSARIIKI